MKKSCEYCGASYIYQKVVFECDVLKTVECERCKAVIIIQKRERKEDQR